MNYDSTYGVITAVAVALTVMALNPHDAGLRC